MKLDEQNKQPQNFEPISEEESSSKDTTNRSKGILLAFTCLILLAFLPIISNSRPSALDALNFAFYLSIWQLICALPLFIIEFRGRKGIFSSHLDGHARRYMGRVMIFTGAIFSLSTYLYIVAFETAGTVNAAIAIQVYPLFAIMVEAILLSQRKSLQELLLTVLLIGGLYHIGTMGTWRLGGISRWFILALSVPLLWSIAHVTLKQTLDQALISPNQITFFRVLISSVLLGLLSTVVNGVSNVSFGLFEGQFQLFAFMMGTVYYLELVIWFYAVKNVDVSVASSITTPTPVATAILAILFLDESITQYQMIGMIVVIVSLYGLVYFGRSNE